MAGPGRALDFQGANFPKVWLARQPHLIIVEFKDAAGWNLPVTQCDAVSEACTDPRGMDSQAARTVDSPRKTVTDQGCQLSLGLCDVFFDDPLNLTLAI